jgi:hypothetical protein
MPRRPSRRRAPRAGAAGDVFVALSSEGLYWDGAGWTPDWRRATHFAGPDPYGACLAVCEGLRAGGHLCSPTYIPRPEV